ISSHQIVVIFFPVFVPARFQARNKTTKAQRSDRNSLCPLCLCGSLPLPISQISSCKRRRQSAHYKCNLKPERFFTDAGDQIEEGQKKHEEPYHKGMRHLGPCG